MNQQQAIVSISKALQSDNPSRYEWFAVAPEGTMAWVAGDYAKANPTIFKARPQGQAGNPCYWSAEYFYASALVLCNAISDPDLKAKCEKDAWDAYCDAYDACAPA